MLTTQSATSRRTNIVFKFSSDDIFHQNPMKAKGDTQDMNELTKHSVARLALDHRSKGKLLPLLHRSLSYPPHIVDSWPHFLSNELEKVSQPWEDSCHSSAKLPTLSPEYLVPRQRIVGGFNHHPSAEYDSSHANVFLEGGALFDQGWRGVPPFTCTSDCRAARKQIPFPKPDHRSILVHVSIQAHKVLCFSHSRKGQVAHDS